jgi:hypothetical protein
MPGSFNDMFAFLRDLMTTHADLFQAHMFRGFAVILLCWFGIQTALSAASGASAFRFDKFATLLMTISFGFGMITYYSHPIPGFGVSFYHLIVDQGLDLANQLNHSMVQLIWDRVTGMYFGLETPGLSLALNIMETVRYFLVVVCLLLAVTAVFSVVCFGYIATAIAVLLGPVFIPFFIVPQLEWLFWGWLKALFQYSFYPVVANAYLYVFGSMLIHLADTHPPPYTGAKLAVLVFPLTMLLLSFAYGVIKIPSLVNSLFVGRSGEHTGTNL